MNKPHAPKILIIDDNGGDVELLRYAFNALNFEYELLVLENGEDALKFIRHHCDCPAPCVVVLDLHLPGADGFTVLKAIRSDPVLASVKVVVVSTSISPQEQAKLASVGADLYREKPYDIQSFMTLGELIVDICQQNVRKAAV